jgi:Antibiotic biosynthesis monooxygenase
MVSFMVRMRFASEDREQVGDILRQLALASRQEPGCISYIPHTVEDDPNRVVSTSNTRTGERASSTAAPLISRSLLSVDFISLCANERSRI